MSMNIFFIKKLNSLKFIIEFVLPFHQRHTRCELMNWYFLIEHTFEDYQIKLNRSQTRSIIILFGEFMIFFTWRLIS